MQYCMFTHQNEPATPVLLPPHCLPHDENQPRNDDTRPLAEGSVREEPTDRDEDGVEEDDRRTEENEDREEDRDVERGKLLTYASSSGCSSGGAVAGRERWGCDSAW